MVARILFRQLLFTLLGMELGLQLGMELGMGMAILLGLLPSVVPLARPMVLAWTRWPLLPRLHISSQFYAIQQGRIRFKFVIALRIIVQQRLVFKFEHTHRQLFIQRGTR